MGGGIVHTGHRPPHRGVNKRGIAYHIPFSVDREVISGYFFRESHGSGEVAGIIQQDDLQAHQVPHEPRE